MAIAVPESRQALADAYALLGTFIGTCTDDPGSTATPVNESTGGTPVYIRKATVWTPGVGGQLTGSAVTIDVPASTISFILLASADAGATMVDKADVTDVVMSAQGQVVVTPSFTQT